MKAEKEEEHFPDEMDTPIDMSARTRFAKLEIFSKHCCLWMTDTFVHVAVDIVA